MSPGALRARSQRELSCNTIDTHITARGCNSDAGLAGAAAGGRLDDVKRLDSVSDFSKKLMQKIYAYLVHDLSEG